MAPNEPTTGTDIHGFDPFPGSLRFPGRDSIPGPVTQWEPQRSNLDIALRFAGDRWSGLRDSSLLKILANYKPGGA